MAEFELRPKHSLAGVAGGAPGVRFAAAEDLGIAAIAAPGGGEDALAGAVRDAWGIELPAVGRHAAGPEGLLLLGMAPDQYFAVFPHRGAEAARVVAARLGGAAHVTEQSDAWVAIDIEGRLVRRALERVCPLDLHPDVFAADMAQRTVMEHLAVVIVRLGEDRFRLMSPSSSALSFLHMVETSVRNIVPDGAEGA